MSVVQELLVEYTRMRDNGLDAKATLHALRPYIEPLPEGYKAQLAGFLRQWENGELQVEENSTSTTEEEVTKDYMPMVPDEPSQVPTPPSPIKPISRKVRPGEELIPAGMKPGATWIACPNCGTKNKASEIFCYACGQLMDSGSGYNSTRHFGDADMAHYPPEHFGKDSIMTLRMRDSGAYFKLRPQQYTHELVIGRSSSNTAMKPDVDLAEENADQFGVSRLHIAIQYMMENSTLNIFDLGSANGSYINGQKLHPSEKRILRNGDELRLGRLVMKVEFEHPGAEIQ